MKTLVKIFSVAVVLAILVLFIPQTQACNSGVSFDAHIAIVKNMLNKGKYTALTNKYIKGKVMVGTYRSEYELAPRGIVKESLLKPNSFKVLYAGEISKSHWENHFTLVSAQKYGIVVAKVLDKETKKVYRNSDGSALVYIFQVTQQKGKTKIIGILNSYFSIIETFDLIP